MSQSDSGHILKDKRSSILYRDDLNRVFLIDIPRSVEIAQSSDPATEHMRLLSSKPQQEPFSSNEPKTVTGRDRLRAQISPRFLHLHTVRAKLISEALDEIKRNRHFKSWCLPREMKELKKREEPELCLQENTSDTMRNYAQVAPMVLSSGPNLFPSVTSLRGSLFFNSFCTSTTIHAAPNQTYIVPPQSAFMMGGLDTSSAAISSAATVLLHGDAQSENGRFDTILIDPPWTNRSVRRSKTYNTNFSLITLRPFLVRHVSKTGFIGIWVTNKEAIQNEVHRVMESCGFKLAEEWLWIKTTISGEPVTELNGSWRRPYEVFLLFQRSGRESTQTEGSVINSATDVRRRIIAAVPDLHSRKPCLKELIEYLLPPSGRRRVLEIFARHLTAGWWAWGDEVLKYNWQGHWAQEKSGIDEASK